MMSDPSMTCEALAAMLPAYLANTLDEDAAEAIESHVSTCAACEAQLERATRIDLESFVPVAPADVRERVLAAIPVAATPARRGVWRPLAVVATLAAAAALYLSTTRSGDLLEATPPQTATVTPPAATAPAGDDRAVDAMVSARALATEQAASEFRSLDEAARELEQALKAAPADREMRAYLDAVQARRAELADKIAEAAS